MIILIIFGSNFRTFSYFPCCRSEPNISKYLWENIWFISISLYNWVSPLIGYHQLHLVIDGGHTDLPHFYGFLFGMVQTLIVYNVQVKVSNCTVSEILFSLVQMSNLNISGVSRKSKNFRLTPDMFFISHNVKYTTSPPIF